MLHEIKATAGAQATSGEFTQSHPESILFTDPYAVLDTLAQKINVARTMESNPEGIGSGLEKEQGALGGEAYRDPFDPQFWQFRPGRGVDGAAAETAGLPTRPGTGNGAGQSGDQTDGDKSWSAPFETDGTTELAQTESGTGPTSEAGTASGDGPSELNGTAQNQIVAHVSRRDQENPFRPRPKVEQLKPRLCPGLVWSPNSRQSWRLRKVHRWKTPLRRSQSSGKTMGRLSV
jgi:chemotaxis protein MotB